MAYVMEDWHLFIAIIVVYGCIVFSWVIKRVFEGMNDPG